MLKIESTAVVVPCYIRKREPRNASKFTWESYKARWSEVWRRRARRFSN